MSKPADQNSEDSFHEEGSGFLGFTPQQPEPEARGRGNRGGNRASQPKQGEPIRNKSSSDSNKSEKKDKQRKEEKSKDQQQGWDDEQVEKDEKDDKINKSTSEQNVSASWDNNDQEQKPTQARGRGRNNNSEQKKQEKKQEKQQDVDNSWLDNDTDKKQQKTNKRGGRGDKGENPASTSMTVNKQLEPDASNESINTSWSANVQQKQPQSGTRGNRRGNRDNGNGNTDDNQGGGRRGNRDTGGSSNYNSYQQSGGAFKKKDSYDNGNGRGGTRGNRDSNRGGYDQGGRGEGRGEGGRGEGGRGGGRGRPWQNRQGGYQGGRGGGEGGYQGGRGGGEGYQGGRGGNRDNYNRGDNRDNNYRGGGGYNNDNKKSYNNDTQSNRGNRGGNYQSEADKAQKTQKQSENIQKIVVIKPHGLKCWPQLSVYIMQTKISFCLRKITDHVADVLIIPYRDLSFNIYPGNIVNQFKIDYRKKLLEKAKEIDQVGTTCCQKCVGLDNFKALGFMKVGKDQELPLCLKNIFPNLKRVKQNLKTLLLPFSQELGPAEIIIRQVFKIIGGHQKIFDKIYISTNKAQDFAIGMKVFYEQLNKFTTNNEICIDY